MHITVFGVVWILFMLIDFIIFPVKVSAQILIISGIFQASAIAIIGGTGIPVFLFTSIYFVFKCIILTLQSQRPDALKIKIPVWGRCLGLFLIYSIFCTIIMPNIFSGVEVLRPVLMIGGKGKEMKNIPLSFSFSNISQLILLASYISCAFCLYKFKDFISFSSLFKAFYLSIILVLLIGFWAYICKQFNLIQFPDSFFYNNTSYTLLYDAKFGSLHRYISTFTEASCVAGFLAPAFWGMAVVKHKWNILILPLIFIALCLTMSATGYAAFICGFGIYILFYSKKYIRFITILLGLFFLIIMYAIGVLDVFLNPITNKLASHSAMIRGNSDLLSLNALLETCLLGVGIGSTRGSSFFINITTSLGVVGLIALGMFLYKILENALNTSNDKKNKFIGMFAFVTLIGQIVALPDLSYSPFWMWIFLASTIKNMPPSAKPA